MRQRKPGAGRPCFQNRRDPRRRLKPTDGFVELSLDGPGGRRRPASLSQMSPAGLAIVMDSDSGLRVGMRVDAVTVNVKDRVIDGDLTIMNIRKEGNSSFTVGCLFHPFSGGAERTWASLFIETKPSKRATPVLAIRCGSCHGTLFVPEAVFCARAPAIQTCGTCTQEYALKLPHLDPNRKEFGEDARTIASGNRIDLPAAYSVLLGLLTPDQVRDMYDRGPQSETSEVGRGYSGRYDRGFREAVEAGLLTVGDAIQRGNRDAFAATLAHRHRLPQSLALAVADNRLSLLKAKRYRGRREKTRVVAPAMPFRAKPTVIAVISVVVLMVATAGAYRGPRISDPPGISGESAGGGRFQRAIEGTSIVKDELGRAIEISGPDPAKVLMAYCSLGRCEAQEIAVPATARPGLRLGVFTQHDDRGLRYAIDIERKGGAHDWVAGNGSDPVAATQAPDLPDGTPRFAIR